MFDPCEEGDSKAGFYYDLKIVVGLLYLAFAAFFIPLFLLGFSALADFGLISFTFSVLLVYLDLQMAGEVVIPRYGWVCSRKDFRLASALLVVSLFLIPVGDYLFNSKIAAINPITFLLSLTLLSLPALLGIAFALSCYIDMGRSFGYWRRNEQITKALLKHSYFYRKIHKQGDSTGTKPIT
jgi:hypothetical protein